MQKKNLFRKINNRKNGAKKRIKTLKRTKKRIFIIFKYLSFSYLI